MDADKDVAMSSVWLVMFVCWCLGFLSQPGMERRRVIDDDAFPRDIELDTDLPRPALRAVVLMRGVNDHMAACDAAIKLVQIGCLLADACFNGR